MRALHVLFLFICHIMNDICHIPTPLLRDSQVGGAAQRPSENIENPAEDATSGYPPLRVLFLSQWVICHQIKLFTFYNKTYIPDFTWSLLWYLNFFLIFHISSKDCQDASKTLTAKVSDMFVWKCYALFSPSACCFWSSKLYFVMS